MPSKSYKITNPKTGKSYSMPWDKETPPTKLDAYQFIDQEEHPSTFTKIKKTIGGLTDKALEPIVPIVSPKMREMSRQAFSANLNDTPRSAYWKSLLGSIPETAADIESFASSPVALATGGFAAAGEGAAALGFGSTSRLMRGATRAAELGLAAEGGHKMYQGFRDKNLQEFGTGAMLFGGGGAAAFRPRIAANPMGDISDSPMPFGNERGTPRLGPGRTFTGPGEFDPSVPIDGEFYSPADVELPPMRPQLALPPARGRNIDPSSGDPLYSGRMGVSRDLKDVVEEGRMPRSPEEAAFNALIPERFKPTPSNLGDLSPWDFKPNVDERMYSGTGQLENVGESFNPPRQAKPRVVKPKAGAPVVDATATPAEATSARPFAKVSDGDLEFLASSGDTAAIAEARLRPSLWDRIMKSRFGSEVGAVGDLKNDPLNPANRGREEPVIDKNGRELNVGKPWLGDKGEILGFTTDDNGSTGFRELRPGENPEVVRQQIISEARGKITGGDFLPPIDEQFEAAKSDPRSARTVDPLVTGTPGPTFKTRSVVERLKGEEGFINPFAKGPKPPKGPKEPGIVERAFQPSEGTHYKGPFADWVNQIKSATMEGQLKSQEFKDTDLLGFKGITDFQRGARYGRLADVHTYLNSKFKQMTDAGVGVDYRENYLPQIWKDKPAKIKEVYRRLGLKPSLTLPRVFETYEAGKAAGLTPRFDKLSDLVGWYERKANKAIADRQFFELMKKNGWIRPMGKGEADWKVLDPNHFPSTVIKGKAGVLKTLPMTADPELSTLLNNYLGDPNPIMKWAADKASLSKNFAMSSGLPFTGVNAHGANILARTVMGNPKEALTAGKYILYPKSAGKYLDANLHKAPEAIKSGLTMTTEGHEMGVSGSTNLAGRALQKALTIQGKMFEDPLFQRIIPALKLKHWEDMSSDLMKRGMDRYEATREASRATNELYGGMNWEAMGRSRDLQNLGRMFILAPDWLETNVRMGVGIHKAMFDAKTPHGKFYAKVARNVIGAYVAANVVNYATSGHLMFQNQPGHALDVWIGNSDNKDRWIRPFGTAADFLRLPFDVAASTLRRTPRGDKWQPDFGTAFDIGKNRASIPASTLLNFATKRDDFGRPFLGKDDYGRPIPWKKQIGGAAGELSDLVSPPYIRGGIDYMSGRSNLEQAALGTIEAPVRYSTPPRRR